MQKPIAYGGKTSLKCDLLFTEFFNHTDSILSLRKYYIKPKIPQNKEPPETQLWRFIWTLQS
ncbi:MAG: hypothetical protein A2287_05970 [Candidatus Melainabacteria bacterium RIFOXYA12_FULL_32_12]|nr:MAG: hypothetical protein A2255_10370 [Candidatus Melainabacteria bacterium RIFOXYA2_FULL_32_9]OGI28603.1 MAG: hypothetical protein A2287_05970 [Candidatus Melainabacteria bacterium RIFOXYA12_FULL_32_12]